MSQVRSGSQAVAAALVGSLASFSLVDVLDLLARTERIGELEVVGPDIDQKIWIDRGGIVDPTSSDPQGAALFGLACIEDGWFYFTVADAAPEGSRTEIATVINEIGPQVAEWRYLVAVLPFDSYIRMSNSTPAEEVQIRGDQWKMLSLVGPGHTVREVIETAGLHPLDALRTLRELSEAGLVAVDGDDDGEEAGDAEGGEQFATKAPLPPFGNAAPPSPPVQHVPASSQPSASAHIPPPPGRPASTSAAAPRPANFVMPPPISGDPWSKPSS